MKLKRTLSLLIALSMLVGLMFTVPAAALTPVEGYAETVVVDESFDKSFSDKLTVFNGSVEEGTLEFTLSSASYMAVNGGFDTKANKQVIIDFDMATTKEYTDPWSASFIGINLNNAQMKPSDKAYGVWVGITADKMVLWFSHKLAKWESEEAVEVVDYLVVDAPIDLSSAAYKVIYEGEVAELYANDELLVSYALDADKYAVLTAGDDVLTSTLKFVDVQSYRYFDIYNAVVENSDDDPLAPQDPEDYLPAEEEEDDAEEVEMQAFEVDVVELEALEEFDEVVALDVIEYAVVNIDNLKVTYLKDLLITEDTVAKFESKKEELQSVIDAYYSEDTEDDLYLSNSLNVTDLENAIAELDDALLTEGLLEEEANAILTAVGGVLADAVSIATAESYPDRFVGFEQIIEELLADPDSDYTEEELLEVQDKIDAAKDLVNEDGVTNNALDDAYNSVLKAIAELNIYTENGIPAYSQSFTGSYTLEQFEKEWYHTGASHQSVPVTTAAGIPINLWGAYPDQAGCFRYEMQLRKSYPVYSVQATLTREAQGRMMFGVRQTLSSDCYEQQYGVTPAMLGYQGVSIQEDGLANNFATIYIVIRDGQYKTSGLEDSRVYTEIDLTSLPGVLSNDNKTFTPLIKDFGEVIEIYAVDDQGENVPLAKVVFDAIVTKVTARGTVYDGYSSGTLYNLVTDEVISFNGMCVQLPDTSVISFSSRSGRYCVKDFQINTNILPAEETLVYDGATDPEALELLVEEDTIAVGGETKFAVNAEFEALKVAGKDEYKAGNIDVKSAPTTEITTTLGDTIVSVDPMAGTITGNARGTEIITVTYTTKDGSVLTEKMLLTVNDDEYTAPTEDDAFEGRIVAARFANATTYKSVEVGTAVVPAIEYEYPNGDTGILPDGCYVKYFSDDEDIMAYDETKGAYVAKAEGYTKLYAEVYMTLSTEPVASEKVNVEVAAIGEATLGASTTVAAMDLVEAAKAGDLTSEEKKAVIDAAIENEIAVSYEDDLDVELIFAALASVAEDDELTNEEIIETASKNAKAVRKVYDVVADTETTSDDLDNLLFGEEGIYAELDIPVKHRNKYQNLTNTKASRAMTRLFAQIEKMGTDITAEAIADSFETILESVSAGGGSGKGGVTITTDKNNGNVGFVTAVVTKPEAPAKVVISAEEINAAAAKFADTEDAAWAKHAIGTLTHKGIINGYEDGTIRPNEAITRDEFVKLLVVAFELNIKADAYNYFYEDVPAGGWQVPYIAAAHEANILSGTNGGAFGSNVRITREDMASMIYKAVMMKKVTLPSDKMVAFTDAENIADNALEAVNKLAAAGVISGMGDGTFAPAAGATRAQAFQMIALILDIM